MKNTMEYFELISTGYFDTSLSCHSGSCKESVKYLCCYIPYSYAMLKLYKHTH